ncbi:MAG: hypothetical protein ACM3JD_19415 [Rudaea sp.]
MIILSIVGILLVLVLPGAALSAALFPRGTLAIEKRVVVTLVLSIAAAALGGLFLNLSTLGLSFGTWAIYLLTVTLGATVIAVLRGFTGVAGRAPGPRLQLGLLNTGLFGVAAAVILIALAVAARPAPQQGLQGYSTLYLLPAANGDPNGYRIGVTSAEFSAVQYDIQLKLNGQVIYEWSNITLTPGQEWSSAVELSSSQKGAGRLEAVLYRHDHPGQAYRQTEVVRTGPGG